jgi:predicted RNase H-like nuclease (RuvC/YqgF family)
MSRRGELEDGLGWGGLVASKAEMRAEREHDAELERLRTENAALKREAHAWSKAAETYAAELERHKPLMQAVEWLLDDGHMNQEHLARLRAAFELTRKT